MSRNESSEVQRRDWQALHDAITETLDQFVRRNAFGDGDYSLVDDNWGTRRHRLEFQNLDLLRPEILGALQALLTGYDDWCITVRVDVPGTEGVWPGMGLIIHHGEIVDDLKREFLPDRFRDLVFGRIDTRTADDMTALVRKLMKPRQGS
jgi:hypothetical protein